MPIDNNPASKKAAFLRRSFEIPAPREHTVEFIESFIDPLALIGSLCALGLFFEHSLGIAYAIVGFLIFSITYPAPAYLQVPIPRLIRGALISWITFGGLLLVFGYTSRLIRIFDPLVVMHWIWLAPFSQITAHLVLRSLAPLVVRLNGEPRHVVIAGLNQQGLALAEEIQKNKLLDMHVVGFFDDRSADRLPRQNRYPVLGKLADLPAYAQSSCIEVIYLSLPMATQPRILRLLDNLRDTTASIYFVPDLFVTDLIQGRMGALGSVPVVAVCESPFVGINGLIKRLTDIVLSFLILLVMSPLMLAIALAVKLTSPGPVIFKQRRYGLDGRQIVVYKFRSMTVCEDGGAIEQASRNDSRITGVGAFLRKTSLDELPQFVNVIQGRMSIVGPRPHAIAHNEEYRKLIKGYMVRHKVRPGITGWAQINGLRGETKTLDRMRERIDFDLDYLRNWSLRLDLYIVLKTIQVIFRDQHAY